MEPLASGGDPCSRCSAEPFYSLFFLFFWRRAAQNLNDGRSKMCGWFLPSVDGAAGGGGSVGRGRALTSVSGLTILAPLRKEPQTSPAGFSSIFFFPILCSTTV